MWRPRSAAGVTAAPSGAHPGVRRPWASRMPPALVGSGRPCRYLPAGGSSGWSSRARSWTARPVRGPKPSRYRSSMSTTLRAVPAGVWARPGKREEALDAACRRQAAGAGQDDVRRGIRGCLRRQRRIVRIARDRVRCHPPARSWSAPPCPSPPRARVRGQPAGRTSPWVCWSRWPPARWRRRRPTRAS